MKLLKAFTLLLLIALAVSGGAAFGQTVFNIKTFGAKCDNVTDDAVAIGKAFTAATGKGAVYIPTSSVAGGACLVASEITYNAATGGQIAIFGDGPTSILKASGASNKVLHITGTAGVTSNPVLIQKLQLQSATSGTSAALLHLDGISHWLVEGVWVDCKNKGAIGMLLTAAQQGQVSGGQIFNCTIGAKLEDNAGAGIRSNGIDWHGMTFGNNTTNNFLIGLNAASPGADELYFHANHLTGASMSMDLAGGVGMTIIANNHFEPVILANNGIILRSGRHLVTGNSFYGIAGSTDLNLSGSVATLTEPKIIGNQINANVVISASVADAMFAFNSTGGVITDAGTRTRNFGNRAFAGTPLVGSQLYDHLTINSQQAAGAAILTLQPPAVAGDWGMNVNGAGLGDTYYRFGNGPIVGGRTDDANVVNIRSAPSGTIWAAFRNTGIIPATFTFATLPAPVNGSIAYCSDCTIANPCAAAGTGAIAKRLNGIWVCN